MENRISISFPSELIGQIDEAIATLEGLLADSLISLTPEENQLYGKLGNETENFAKMVHDDCVQAEHMIPAFVDRTEWNQDMAARNVLNPRITRFKNLLDKMDQTNRLIGFDIYQTTLSVYNNAKVMSAQNIQGANTFYSKWKVQYPRNSRKNQTKQQPA